MKTLRALLRLLAVALTISVPAAHADTTEMQAIQKVKALPEFTAYAKSHQHTFDDNELITEPNKLPSFIDLPAWRIDVRTVVKDSVADHTSLWNRFVLSSSRTLYVWDRVGDRYLTVKEWRSLGNRVK